MPEKVLQVEYLIVGGGIAGCTLALELYAAGKQVMLLDPRREDGGSRVAAGIVNPIVPKGVKKTWACERIFPGLESVYRRWEGILGQEFFRPMSLFQVFGSADMAREWATRMLDPEMQEWISPGILPLEDMIPDENGHCLIHYTGRLDVRGFCDAVMAFFEARQAFSSETFAYAELKTGPEGVEYRGVQAAGVVFCEGMGVRGNPWFGSLPFIAVGGDVLELAIHGLPRQRMFKNGHWLLPVDGGDGDRFLAGSNYHAGNDSRVPEPQDADTMLAKLRTWITGEIRLVEQRRGVRPTVQRRRPYIGRHPEQDRLYIFNGFGSKGVSLCSWLAPLMREFLTEGKQLPEEVGF